jgi:hypothetical protein
MLAVYDLRRHPGWAIVSKMADDIVSGLERQLRSCKPDELARLQGQIYGVEQMCKYVDGVAARLVKQENQS